MNLRELVICLSDINNETRVGNFVKILFLNFTSNEETLNYLEKNVTLTMYTSYVKNKSRRKFTKIAKKVYSNPDSNKFINYLKEHITQDNQKVEICQKLSTYIPHITIDTMYDRITLEFYNIIGKEIGYPDVKNLSDLKTSSQTEVLSVKDYPGIKQSSNDSSDINDDSITLSNSTIVNSFKTNELQMQEAVLESQKPKTLVEDIVATLDSLFGIGGEIARQRNIEIEVNKDIWETTIYLHKYKGDFKTNYITSVAIKNSEKKLHELFIKFTHLRDKFRSQSIEIEDKALARISCYMDNITISIFTEDSILKDYAFIPSEERKNALKLRELLSKLLSEKTGKE